MTTPAGGRINPAPIVYQALKQGLSANEGLALARAQGLGMRRATWLQMYSQARALQVAQIEEFAAPLGRSPYPSEIRDWSTKSATGHIQYVEIYVRDKGTGIVSTRPFSIRVDNLITRQEAVNRGLNRFAIEAHPEGNYPTETVIGAAYSGTYRLVPRDPEE